MRRRGRLSIILLSISLTLSLFTNAVYGQSTKPAPAAKLSSTERLLKESGADYSPFQGDDSFIVSYKGKQMGRIDLIIIDADKSAVIFADVAAGRELNMTQEVMRKLLEFNLRSDYIKVGISDIGSIRVQTEQILALMDAKNFDQMLDQVAAGSDEIAAILKPAMKAGAVEK